jgi:IS30 family transposase
VRLTLQERESIFAGICEPASDRLIAARLGRPQSTVSREIARNGGRGAYRPSSAQARADRERARPKVHKLAGDRRLHDEVSAKLTDGLSPQQVTGRLVREFPDEPVMRVSHETIYQTLYLQGRGALRTELTAALRTGRAQRVPRGTARPRGARISGMVLIRDRPGEVEDRAVPGHWEGDLIIGKNGKSQVATLVERHSRFVMLVKLNYDRTAERVAIRLAEQIQKLPAELRRSLTWDQGVEMAAHAKFTVATNIPVYFCDPHSPWQRGSNENTNGLLRQYLPKSTDLSVYSQAELDDIAARLNRRPRQTLDFRTPAEALDEALQQAVMH